jgi:hypothetical protein
MWWNEENEWFSKGYLSDGYIQYYSPYTAYTDAVFVTHFYTREDRQESKQHSSFNVSKRISLFFIVTVGWDVVCIDLRQWRDHCPSPSWYMNEYGETVKWYWQKKTEGLFATLTATNPTWNALEVNPGLSNKMPAANHLICCTVWGQTCLWLTL